MSVSARTLVCLLSITSVLWNASAQEALGPGSEASLFELNSTMVTFDAPSTYLFLGWQTDVNALFQDGLDCVSAYIDLPHSNQILLRSATLGLFTGVSLVVNRAFSLTAHDEGHMEAARAIGASAVYLESESNGQEMSIWEFFLQAFFTSEPGLYVYSMANPTPTEQAYVAGEGLDTNLLIAAALSRKIDEGAGHITDLAPYLVNKTWGIGYFQETGADSDALNYMGFVNEQGYGTVTSNAVIFLSAASFLLSGGFLALMRGAYDFIADGDPIVRPLGLQIGGLNVFWPEFTTWLNPQNVSLEAMLAAAWEDAISFEVRIDVPVLGYTSVTPELTFGTKVKIDWLTLGAEATSSFVGFPFLEGSVEFALTKMFSLGIKGYFGEGNTMRELREYPLGPGVVGFVRAKI